MAELARDVSVCYKFTAYGPSATAKNLVWGCTPIPPQGIALGYSLRHLIKADKLNYNGLSCLVAG